MRERLVEIYVPPDRLEAVRLAIEATEPAWSWESGTERAVLRVAVPADRVEALLDPLQPVIAAQPDARILVLPLEATVPDIVSESTPAGAGRRGLLGRRISRQELYEDLESMSRTTPEFLITTGLAAVIAAIGLAKNQAAVVVGAMVIAPLLGPSMALTLATTLGDLRLGGRAARTSLAGFAVAFGVSVAAAFVWQADPSTPEIASRTALSLGDLVVALATGAAGALAVTTGVASALVGVMVAVALLPPVAVAALLLVSGHYEPALNAVLLAAANIICINLAGVAVFRLQGVRPRSWWAAERSQRATRLALTVWLALLLLVAVIVSFTGLAGR